MISYGKVEVRSVSIHASNIDRVKITAHAANKIGWLEFMADGEDATLFVSAKSAREIASMLIDIADKLEAPVMTGIATGERGGES